MSTEKMMVQGSEAWHAARRESVGASEVASLFGVGYRSAVDIWMDKTGRGTPVEETADMRRGRAFEPVAAGMWREAVGAEQDGVEFFHAGLMRDAVTGDTDHMHASPDIIALMPDGARVLGEVKVPRPLRAVRMREEGPDLAWVLQCQQGMYCCDCDRAEIVVLDVMGGTIDRYPVRRSEKLIDMIRQRVALFWGYVVRDEPPYDMMEEDRETLAELRSEAGQPVGTVEAGEAPAPGPVLILDYKDACDRARYAEEQKEAAKEALESWFASNLQGGTGKAFFESTVANRYSIAGRKSLNMDLLRAEHPAIDWARYEVTGKPSAAIRLSAVKVETKKGGQ